MLRDGEDGPLPFAATFVPVDVSITTRDIMNRSFTVQNDRPQAGAVQYDKSVKLLMQRAIRTNDQGGIPEIMYDGLGLPQKVQTFNFEIKAYATEEGGKWLAHRQRNLLALYSDRPLHEPV